LKLLHKQKLPQISREELEEAVKSYLEKGGQITRIEFIEPKQKNHAYTASPLRFVDEDDVNVLDGIPEFSN